MTTTTLTKPLPQTAGVIRPILVSALFGALLVFVTGFASSDTLHAATHDTRHATGFPCH